MWFFVACTKSAPVPATEAPLVAMPARFEPLRVHLGELSDMNRWQGGLTLMKHGQPLLVHTSGRRQPDGEPVDANTQWHIGSISKTFTATMVMQLVEEERLSLRDPLSTWFPDAPHAERITIDHLLNHRSGLFNFTDDPAYPSWMETRQERAELSMRMFANDPVFEPGAQGGYSNTNFVLLGWILEDLDGRSYAASLQARITTPLALARTALGDGIQPSKNETRSMTWQGDRWKATTETDPSVPGGAGAIVSNPTELCRFAEALHTGKLLSMEHVEKMREITDGYGRGLYPIPFNGENALGHSGAIDGFTSMLARFEDGICLAITTHAANTDTNDIAIAALSVAYGLPYEPPTVTPPFIPAASVLEGYAGRYRSTSTPLGITLRNEGSTLFAKGEGQPEFVLDAASDTEFKFAPARLEIRFDAAGFVVEQGGQEHRYRRESL